MMKAAGVAITALALALVFSQLWEHEGPDGDCAARNFRVKLPDASNVSASPCTFSETYFEAREKFRQGARVAGAALHTLPVMPGDDFTIDIAILEGSGPGLVVHTSGVHGVEGFTGSAIQIAALDALIAQKRGEIELVAPTIVLVHAVNPYGMVFKRRPNEHNVDLNRNALHGDEWEGVLKRDPNIAGYDDFDEILFNPRREPTTLDMWAVWLWFPLAMARQTTRAGDGGGGGTERSKAIKHAMVSAQCEW